MKICKRQWGLLFLLFALTFPPALRADTVELHPLHPIKGLNLRWVDVVYITWFDRVSDDRWVVTIGLQVDIDKRPAYKIEFPDEDTTDRPLGTYLLLALINHSGQIIMRSQRLIPGAEFIGVHYARVRTLNPNAPDDECAYIVTPDFQRFYCFNTFLELLHRFRLPSRALGFDVFPDDEGNPALLVVQKRDHGWFHLLDPKTGKPIRSWVTTAQIINAMPNHLDPHQRHAIRTFLDHPEVDVMELPNVALAVQAPLIILFVSRNINFYLTADDHSLKSFKTFDLSFRTPPVKILYGPAFTLEHAFPASAEKPLAKTWWLYGTVDALTRVSDLANIHLGLFLAQKKRYRSVKHRVVAVSPILLELNLETGKTAILKQAIMTMEANNFYVPETLVLKKQHTLYGILDKFQLDPFRSQSILGYATITSHARN